MDARWPENAKYCFLQKSASFSNGDYCVQNLPYRYLLQIGFKQILKG